MTPDQRALLRLVASRPVFLPARPAEVRGLVALVEAGLVEKYAGCWRCTQAGKAMLAREEEKVK